MQYTHTTYALYDLNVGASCALPEGMIIVRDALMVKIYTDYYTHLLKVDINCIERLS